MKAEAAPLGLPVLVGPQGDALVLPPSQRQTEGHSTCLRALKRQMFGRASFDVLRKRFLSAA